MPRRVSHLAGYVALAIVATWPLVPNITTHAPGADLWLGRPIFPETSANLWNLWWFRFSTVDLGQSPLHTGYVFYPFGADLRFHTMSLLFGAVGVVLQTTLGLVTSLNVLILASIVSAGLGMSLLARRMGLTDAGAFVAGCVFAFAAGTMRHLYVAHFELIWTAWLPIALWAFLRVTDTSERRGIRLAVLLGLVVGATVYSSAYYAVYAAELLILVALVRWREVFVPRVLGRLVLAAILAVAVASPIVRGYLGGTRPFTQADVLAHDFRTHSVEPLGWIVPSFTHPIARSLLGTIHLKLSRGDALPQETTGTIALTVIALAGLALARRRTGDSTIRLALWIAIVFAILSLGSDLKFLGRPTGIPLPATLFEHVPVRNNARAPGRLIIVSTIGFALLAGLGWQAIRDRRWKSVAAATLAFELLPAPLPLIDMTVPSAYARVAESPGSGAVLDLPLGMRDGMRHLGQPNGVHLRGQTVHHRPILGGVVSRQPDAYWRAIAEAPLIGTLLDPSIPLAPPADAEAYFDKWQIDVIVVSPQASIEERRAVESSLAIARRERLGDGWEVWWRR